MPTLLAVDTTPGRSVPGPGAGGGVTRPRLLDLFHCAGVGADGYAAAGFDVVGVDIDEARLRESPYPTICADAMEILADLRFLRSFDVVHASPPCQAFTQMSARWRGKGTKADTHVDLLTPTRELLRRLDRPWVIENVTGAKAHMATGLVLHGGMFGLGVHRPRRFESNVLLMAAPAARVRAPLGVYGTKPDGRTLYRYRNAGNYVSGGPPVSKSLIRAAKSVEEGAEAMGVTRPVSWEALREAIPPAYTEFIGAQLMAALEVAA